MDFHTDQIWIIAIDQIWSAWYYAFMDPRFSPHNIHLENPDKFLEDDPQLSRLRKQIYIYESPILTKFPINMPGIYTLSGGRQIGKTTMLKQWMAKLLKKKISPNTIFFITGEIIDDYHSLLQLLQQLLIHAQSNPIIYLIIDEVTYIKDWDKAIKFAADSGLLDHVELILTGSDSVVIKEARMRLPGRRGKSENVDFHVYPLSFYEVVKLKNVKQNSIPALFNEFDNYLKHGGYLTAINDMASNNSISVATLNTYSDWIRGDVLKRGKQEHYLRDILSAIIKRYGSQITWHSLSRDLSVDHHKTVADYVELLASMDAIFIQCALMEDKLTGAAKKARKIVFTDPFIFHAIRSWLWPVANPYQTQICTAVADPQLSAQLVDACAATHFSRFYPTYYIKAEGEVDIAYIDNKRFWPIEIKWTNQLHSKDLKQISKYTNGLILTKSQKTGFINNVPSQPLPLGLLKLR